MAEDIDLVDLVDGFLEDVIDMVTQHARRTTDEHGNVFLDSGGLSANRNALKVLSDIGILKQFGDPKYPQYIYVPGASAAFIERIRKQYESLKSRAAVGDAVEAMKEYQELRRGATGFYFGEFHMAIAGDEIRRGATAREALGLKAKEVR